MGNPIYILAGQSNAVAQRSRFDSEVKARIDPDAITGKTFASGAPLTTGRSKLDWFTPDELPLTLFNTVKTLLEQNPEAHFAGVIWLQGEADTHPNAPHEKYLDNLFALIENLRTQLTAEFGERDVGAQDFIWVQSALSNQAPAKPGRDHWNSIREQQVAAAAADDRIVFADPDAISAKAKFNYERMFGDGLHYSSDFKPILLQGLLEAAVPSRAGALDNLLQKGGEHSDVMISVARSTRLAGLEGDDIYLIDNKSTKIIEHANHGHDLVKSSVSYDLETHLEDLTLTGDANIRGAGNRKDNTLTGNDNDNRLIGKDGDDTLIGGGGDDRLVGGAGADDMQGGEGDDTYFVNSRQDSVADTGGHDHVIAKINYRLTLADGEIENLTLGGGRDISGRGNDADNVITGNAGDNLIRGGGGSDTLIGGAGDDILRGDTGADILTGGQGADRFVFRKSGGADEITDFIVGEDTLVFAAKNLSKLTISGDGQNTIIEGPGDTQVTLRNVAELALTEDSFVFI